MNIYNAIILDESGSMSSIYRETLSSMNEVLSGIRRTQEENPTQQHYVTIVTFEGSGMDGVKTRRDRVPVGNISPFTEKDYRPGGCTPLYDAMGKTLSELEGLILPEDRVVVTVITDGYENSSTEYSGRIIKNMVSRLREKGWVLAYIGANQNSVEVARDLNIANALDFSASEDGMKEVSLKLRKANAKMSRVFECPSVCLSEFDSFFEDEK